MPPSSTAYGRPLTMLRPLLLSLWLCTLLTGCHDSTPAVEPASALRPGGDTSVSRHDAQAFAQPAQNLSPERRLDFSVGNSFFRNPWVSAPASTTARDGLGPLFNTNACINCHQGDGRGQVPSADARHAVGMLVRLSIPHTKALNPQQANLPEPTYGSQVQDMAIAGVQPEARIRVSYSPRPVQFADGTVLELRQPQLEISALNYGPLHPETRLSARIAPAMIGLGLLEAIPEADILSAADPDDLNHDGISGRPNWVWDERSQSLTLGRFGWKAGQPSLAQQNAHAFANDLGLTSSLQSSDDCTQAQALCRQQINGGQPEVSDNIFNKVEFYTRLLAVPTRRQMEAATLEQGRALFYQANCHACHTPSHRTAKDAAEQELANQLIWPYTDLLLHDLGNGLADQHSEFSASGREWRTAPLWGIGLSLMVNPNTSFLHDGRARNLLEAILWHGGEAETSRQTVLSYDAEQRAALLAFLHSL